MTNDDFKKLLDEAVEPLKDGLKNVQKDLTGVKQDLVGVKQDISEVKKDLTGVKQDQADLRKIIEEQVLPPLIYVETTVKSYADRYVANEDHIGRLQNRLNTVEDRLGIQPPEELIVPSII